MPREALVAAVQRELPEGTGFSEYGTPLLAPVFHLVQQVESDLHGVGFVAYNIVDEALDFWYQAAYHLREPGVRAFCPPDGQKGIADGFGIFYA